MTDKPMTSDQLVEDKHELISLAEAARRYGFSQDYLSKLARKGRLKAQKIGRNWVTTPADVEQYIRSRRRRGAYRNDIQA
ncbi:MAG TPA: DNA-binding protein [Anaerolineae bacterium]|nr:DNA-binding protein [Anaerolineae bacterium]